jgi:hypothetical protein
MENNKSTDGGKYEANGSAAHYKDTGYLLEFMQDTEYTYGTRVAYIIAEVMSKKYRSRMGLKEGVSLEKDFVKAEFYRKLCVYYKRKISDKADIAPVEPVKTLLEHGFFPPSLDQLIF